MNMQTQQQQRAKFALDKVQAIVQELGKPEQESESQTKEECRYLVKDFGTSMSPKSTRLRDSL